jgi:hypothetical protein
MALFLSSDYFFFPYFADSIRRVIQLSSRQSPTFLQVKTLYVVPLCIFRETLDFRQGNFFCFAKFNIHIRRKKSDCTRDRRSNHLNGAATSKHLQPLQIITLSTHAGCFPVGHFRVKHYSRYFRIPRASVLLLYPKGMFARVTFWRD